MTEEASLIAALQARVNELEARVKANTADTELLQAVLKAVPAFIIRMSPALRIQFVNRITGGVPEEKVIGSHIEDWIAPEHRHIAREAILRAIETRQPQHYELDGFGRKGPGEHHYETRIVPIHDPQEGVSVVMVAYDVTEARQQARALQESEASLRIALDATQLGLWSWNAGTDKVSWNDRMFQICGVDTPVNPVGYLNLVHPEEREFVSAGIKNTLATGEFRNIEHRILRPDGSQRWVVTFGKVQAGPDGAPGSIIGGTLDLTEQRHTEEQLRHAQKMEAIGQLTAGVAHNFNNMLSIMLPTLQILERSVPEDRKELLRGALDAGQRAAELVQNMVRFAREPSTGHRHVLSAEDLVRHAVDICRRVFDPSIRIEERYEAPGALARVSGSDIEQTLVNLLLNARDALEFASSPRLLVELTRPEPGRLLIRISDNGAGIPEEIQGRLFQPFFTTKDPGRGTGLGLATAYATLRDHEGTISFTSAPGQGTTFSLSLPAWSGAVPVPLCSIPPPSPVPGRGRHVLIVDDEEPVRRTLSWLLQDAGYRCSDASCAAEALACLAVAPGADVVLLDRSMPGGLSTLDIDRLRELAPRCRVLLHTGNPPPTELARRVDGVLLKPASRELLLERIVALLD